MLSTAEKRLYAEYQESPSTFSTISTTDPTARRNAKIANFKMEKELKKKLDVCVPGVRWVDSMPSSPRTNLLAWCNMLTISVSGSKSSLSTKRRRCHSRVRNCQAILVFAQCLSIARIHQPRTRDLGYGTCGTTSSPRSAIRRQRTNRRFTRTGRRILGSLRHERHNYKQQRANLEYWRETITALYSTRK